MKFYLLVRIVSVTRLAKRVKAARGNRQLCYQRLGDGKRPSTVGEAGFLPVYVGEEKELFIIPTGFLSHPLFRMLLDMAYREYGFEQRSGLMFPCNVAVFQEVVSAVECPNEHFNIQRLVEELI